MNDKRERNAAFAARLKQLMEQRELTQSALASKIWGRMLNSEGIEIARGRDRISAWASGALRPNAEQMEKLAQILGVTASDLDPISEPLILDPGATMQIDTVYAFMTIDEKGRNGVIAEILPDLGTTPFVASSLKAVELMKPIAQRLAKRTGKTVGLFRFTRDAQLWQTD
jgi:transcriptional regulator with XRE-family HTH domain